MYYTDHELKRYWSRIGKTRQKELLDTMLEVAGSEFAGSLLKQWKDDREFSPRQIAAVRKWDRE